jgi:hypothetical protein
MKKIRTIGVGDMILSGIIYREIELKSANAQIIGVYSIMQFQDSDDNLQPIYKSQIMLTEMADSKEKHSLMGGCKRKIIITTDDDTEFSDDEYEYIGTVIDYAPRNGLYGRYNRVPTARNTGGCSRAINLISHFHSCTNLCVQSGKIADDVIDIFWKNDIFVQ